MKTLEDLASTPGQLDTAAHSDVAIFDSWEVEDGLDLFYRRYAERVRRFCQTRLNNSIDAEDACHETILRAYAARSSFRPGAPIWPWLSVIAKNVCIDVQRSQSRTIPTETVEIPYEDLEFSVAARARAEIVHLALADLPKTYSVHLYLRDFRGWSYEDIARFLDTSVAAVRSTLMRARQALKKVIVRQSSARGMWPLPALIPTLTQSFKDLSRRFQRPWASTRKNARWSSLIDPGTLVGIVNVVTALSTLAFQIDRPAEAAPPPLRATPVELSAPSGEPVSSGWVDGGSVVSGQDETIVQPSTATFDLDRNGESDAGMSLGPLWISCNRGDPEPLPTAACTVVDSPIP